MWMHKETGTDYNQARAAVAVSSPWPGAYREATALFKRGGANQQWLQQDQGDGSFRLVSRSSKECLDVANGSAADGARLVQWPCGGAANQQFQRRTV